MHTTTSEFAVVTHYTKHMSRAQYDLRHEKVLQAVLTSMLQAQYGWIRDQEAFRATVMMAYTKSTPLNLLLCLRQHPFAESMENLHSFRLVSRSTCHMQLA